MKRGQMRGRRMRGSTDGMILGDGLDWRHSGGGGEEDESPLLDKIMGGVIPILSRDVKVIRRARQTFISWSRVTYYLLTNTHHGSRR